MRHAITSRIRDAIGLSVVLVLLASCGGGGGGGGSSAPPGSKLFISDGGNHAIASIINAAPTLTSTFTVDRVIQGSSTGLGLPGGTPSVSSIPSMALDAPNDRLFVATQLSVVTFDHASVSDGNISSSRFITGLIPASGGGVAHGVNFLYIDVDKTNDRLYSVDPAGEVHVYNGISALNGTNLAPNRTITGDFGGATVNNVFGIAIDVTRDLLYVGLQLNTTQTIAVFANASTANTTTTPLAPTETLTFTFGIGSIFLDATHDRLYLSQFDGKVLVLDSASGLASGAPAANRTIDLTGGLATIQFYIFVDASRDKLYAVGNQQPGPAAANDEGFLLIIDNASTANDVPPGGPNASDGVGVTVTASNIRLSAVAVAP